MCYWHTWDIHCSRRHRLGHYYGMCEHLSLNHNLSQVLTAILPVKSSWVQLRRQAGSCWQLLAMRTFYLNITCRCNILSYLRWNGWKLHLHCINFDSHFAPIWVCLQSIADALGTHQNRSPNIDSSSRQLRCRLVSGIREPGLIIINAVTKFSLLVFNAFIAKTFWNVLSTAH